MGFKVPSQPNHSMILRFWRHMENAMEGTDCCCVSDAEDRHDFISSSVISNNHSVQ